MERRKYVRILLSGTRYSVLWRNGGSGKKEPGEVLKINPKFSLEQIEKTTPHKDPAIRARFIDSLHKAGLK